MRYDYVMSMPNKEVISLLRLSTAEQAANDRSGLDRQRGINRATAAAHSLTIRREIEAVDVSGRHVRDDPQFQQLFRELETDPTLAGIVVSEQSRLVRPEKFEHYTVLDIFARNRKMIWTPGGVIDATTEEGIMSLTLNGMMSGQELRKIKDRCISGKRVLRDKGLNPCPAHALPRTVRYVKIRNENGKVIDQRWELVPLMVERVKRAYQLLFEGQSYRSIAEQVGGLSPDGFHKLMQNPIHIGIRRYAYTLSPEYMPKATVKNPYPKRKRRSILADQPIDVPTREELILGTKQPIVPPIISMADFDRAQEIMRSRITRWRKGKIKNDGRPRFLLNQVYCGCGEPVIGKYGSDGKRGQIRPFLDRYVCRSTYPGDRHGEQGCRGEWRSIRRMDLEACVIQMIERLADRKFLTTLLKQLIVVSQPKPDPAQAQREAALRKHDQGRQTLLAMVRAGDISRAEFKAQMAILEHDKKATEALAPPPQQSLDPATIAIGLINTFQGFGMLAFGRQRAILQGALKRIIINGNERTVHSVTISGGYLGGSKGGVNSPLLCSQYPQIDNPLDFVLKFPQPISIPVVPTGVRRGRPRKVA